MSDSTEYNFFKTTGPRMCTQCFLLYFFLAKGFTVKAGVGALEQHPKLNF